MAGFVFYDLSFLAVFTIAVVIFLYVKRKNLKREGILYLYKTKIGLKVIDNIAKKFPKTLRAMSYAVVIVGYGLMIASFYLLYQIISMFSNPAIVQAIKVPPIMPLIPYLPSLFQITWLPPFYFTYWIVAIAIIAITHEGFHGIFARFYKVKIKSTGFGFLGPLLAFFVEQDDKQLKKAKIFPQLTVIGGGTFANVLCAIVFGILMMGFINAAYSAQGVNFNDYTYSGIAFGALNNMSLTHQNNQSIAIDGLNFTGVEINNTSYFVPSKVFDSNYSKTIKNSTLVKIYWDEPAIRNSLKGAIIKIDGSEINNVKDISTAIDVHKPGDNITLVTRYKQGSNVTIITYNFTLGVDYSNSSRAIMGTATNAPPSYLSFKGFFYNIMNGFRDPTINYEPKFNEELTIFIYNLLMWIVLISISVAITNMLPLGIFDGGRFFYLTVLAITKKEKTAEKSFKWATWIILGIVALSMLLWGIGIM